MIDSMVATLRSSTLADGGFWKETFFRGAGKASYSGDVDRLFLGIWWVSVAAFIGLMTLMFYFVIKYRRRPGVPAQRSVSHNMPLEIAWTVIPTIFFVFMFFGGFFVYAKEHVAPGDAMQLDLTASKWTWSITYPNGSGATEEMLLGALERAVFLVPEDTPIQLQMTSTDVIHSFWVPDFRLKVDIFPNRYTSYWFKTAPLEPGEEYRDHWIFCAEYCGDQHSEMAATLRVVSREQFGKWLREPFKDSKPLVEVGKTLYGTKGCASCHTVDGKPNTGPTWQNLFGSVSQYTDGSSATMDFNQIRESIYIPSAKIRLGFQPEMTTYQGGVSLRELTALIAYMQSISDNAPTPALDRTWGDTAPADDQTGEQTDGTGETQTGG